MIRLRSLSALLAAMPLAAMLVSPAYSAGASAPLVAQPPARAAFPVYTAAAPTTLGPWATCDVQLAGARRGAAVALLRVPVALTQAQQETGLRVSTGGGVRVMLFTWPRAAVMPFWMQGVPQALTVAFFASNGAISRVTAMAPNTTTRHLPPGPAVAALEAPTPLLEAIGIGPGALFRVTHCPIPALVPFAD